MPTAHEFSFGGERLVAYGDRTLWWPAARTLLVTDLHAGKAAHLRRYGSAVPDGSLAADLDKLERALARDKADRLLFLGDLFHSELNHEWPQLAAWCQAQSARIGLVRGNHDRFITSEQLRAAGMDIHDEPYRFGPFDMRHHPLHSDEAHNAPVIAGHVHPVCHVFGSARDHLRLPCFWLQRDQLILPAFGSLTGGYDVAKLPRVSRFACAPDDTIWPL